MHPIAFRDYLWEVRKYLTLTPGTKAHKEAFHDLCEKLPDADTFDPQVKKWERITLICALLLLLAGDSEEDRSTALLTLALYMIM